VTAVRTVRLWCDHRDDPPDGQQFGKCCFTVFEPPPDLGWISQISVMRKEAAKAGWKYVRHPRTSALDADFCPKHNPDRKQQEDTP
jgi:hypothetical protein